MKNVFVFIFILVLEILYVNCNTFFFVKGNNDSTTDQYCEGGHNFSSPVNFPGGRSDSFSFNQVDQTYLYMFSGKSCNKSIPGWGFFLSDLWKFSVVSENWIFVKGFKDTVEDDEISIEFGKYHRDNIPPGGSGGISFLGVGQNSAFLMGGWKLIRYRISEVWEFSFETENFRKVASKTPNFGIMDEWDQSNFPLNLAGASVSKRNPDDKYAYISGGVKVESPLDLKDYNTVWEMDLSTNLFRRVGGTIVEDDGGEGYVNPEYGVFTVGNVPAARYYHMSWMRGNLLYVSRGFSRATFKMYTDTWAMNLTSKANALLSGTNDDGDSYYFIENEYNVSNIPSVKQRSAHWTSYDVFMFFSGSETSMIVHPNDVWVFSPTLNMFKLINGTISVNTEAKYSVPMAPNGRDNFNYWKYNEDTFYFGFGLKQPGSYILSDLWVYTYFESDCNQRGNLVTGVECDCLDNYYGRYCQHWNCSEVPNYKKSEVCHGNGDCVEYNDCDCDYGYEKNSYCSKWMCYGITYDDPTTCYSHKGNCIDVDTCNCTAPNYYGNMCHELIERAYFKGKKELYVIYTVEVQLLPSDVRYTEEINCSRAIYNHEKLGEDPRCFFGYSDDKLFTTQISISLSKMDYSLAVGEQLIVKALTRQTDLVYLTVTRKKEKFNAFDYWWTFFTPIPVIAFCICFVCIIIGTLVICTIIQRRKIRKFDSLKDFDILLQEQKARRRSSQPQIKINQKLFEIPYKDVDLVREIGTGGSGCHIYLAKWRGKEVAFKVFRVEFFSSGEYFDEFEREVNLISSLNHPHVLDFYGCCMNPPRVGIITEFCVNGPLSRYIGMKANFKEDDENESFSIFEKVRMVKEIAMAMEFLHDKEIIHRDLKTENALLNPHFTIKLIDFGLSKIVERKSNSQHTQRVGTSCYMAPEMILSRKYDVLMENLNPYGNESNIEVRVANNPKFRPKIPKEFEMKKEYSWYLDLIRKCWDHDCTKRPSFRTILKVIDENSSDFPKEEDKPPIPRRFSREFKSFDEVKLKVDILEGSNKAKDLRIKELEKSLSKKTQEIEILNRKLMLSERKKIEM